jgi:hypothetical protein
MATRKTLSRGLAVAAVSVGLSAALAPAAQAVDTFTLHGVFNGTTTDPTTGTGTPVITDTVNAGSAGANILTANEPFTLTVPGVQRLCAAIGHSGRWRTDLQR